MKPIEYYKSLTTDQKKLYAVRAGCSMDHFKSNVFRVKGGAKKTPKPELLIRLVKASEGNVSINEAIDYFHTQPIRSLAKAMGVEVDAKGKGVQLEIGINNETKKAK